MIETLETRALLHAPVLDTISNYSVPVNGYLQIPITSSDSENDNLTYSVTVSNNGATAGFHSGNTWLEMGVSGKTGAGDTAFSGTMLFQLFNDIAPRTAAKIAGLAQTGYYDGLTFHRVLKGFMAQGGDPSGNGTGGPGFATDSEINQYTMYTGDGQLAMARQGNNHSSDGSQFFITDGNQRAALDYAYTLFGQLVSGRSTLTKLLDTRVQSNGQETSDPVNDPKVTTARIVANNSDGVLQIKAGANTGTTTVTVTVTNEHGESDSQSFTLTRVADSQNGRAYLNAINPHLTTAKNTPITFTIAATDPDGDTISYAADILTATGASAGTAANGSFTINGNQITVTPKTDYTGPLYVIVGVLDPTQQEYDTEVITIGVGDKAASGAAQSLNAAAGTTTPGMVVATFTDADSAGTAADWTSVVGTNSQGKIGGINWGDGTFSNGTISKSGSTYYITGNHEYPATGTYEVTSTIIGSKGAKQIIRSTITVRNIAEVSSGILRIYGSSGNDSIGTSVSSGKVNATVNGVTKKFTSSTVQRVEYYLYEGDDAGSVGAGVPVTYMDGGAGNDNLTGGSANDTLTGGAGKNTLSGGAGADRINGSGGRDFIYGQEGDDRMYGNGGDDYIDGGGGVDRAWGGAGNDVLIGGSSNDKLYGEADKDTLFGGNGNDWLDGGTQTDVLGDTIGTDTKTSIP